MTAMVPEAASLDAVAWGEAEAIITRALAPRPARVRRQIAVFLLLLEAISLARYRRRLAALTPPQRGALLESLSRSRLLLLRRGIWGVRTLSFMGYYARRDAARAIGYRATPGGWNTRRATTDRA
jgi:hypothetical protein